MNNAERLISLSMVPPLADEVVRQINSGGVPTIVMLEGGQEYTLSAINNGGILAIKGVGSATVTIPSGLPGAFRVDVPITESAMVEFVAGPGVVLHSSDGNEFMDANTIVFVRPVGVDDYILAASA